MNAFGASLLLQNACLFFHLATQAGFIHDEQGDEFDLLQEAKGAPLDDEIARFPPHMSVCFVIPDSGSARRR
jgi:hypothetical protein